MFPECSPKGLILSVLRIFLLTYVLFGALLYLRQDDSLFFPPATPMGECAEFSPIEILTIDGTRGYYVSSGTSTKLAVLYHGNAERACDSASFANWIADHGYNVLLVEFLGYAGDLQKPSVALLLRDTEHVDAWIKTRDFSDLLIVGRSIGTGFASYHASLASPEKLLLISPFDTLSQAAKEHYPVYPTALLMKTELDNVRNAAFAKEVLIIHGTDDAIIPIERGKALFEQLPQREKTFIAISGHAHDDVLGALESWAAIKAFLE